MSDYNEIDGKWIKGTSSIYSPNFIEQGEYAWLQNGDNSGGVIANRPGFNALGVTDPLSGGGLLPVPVPPAPEPQEGTLLPSEPARGMFIFKDLYGNVHLVVAVGANFYKLTYPFIGPFILIPGGGFPGDGPVYFAKAYKSTELMDDGTTVLLPDSYPILCMQDGVSMGRTWIGGDNPVTPLPSTQPPVDADPLHASPYNIPIGTWMIWSGGRLWVATGKKLHASDYGDPIHWREEQQVAGGGTLFFIDDITGLNQTNNLQSLLVGTDYDMSAVQSSVTDRTKWGLTPGFQQVILPGIGVAAGKSFCRQWGMVWWYSHGGLIALDQALNTYRTSAIQFQDQGMMKSKSKLSPDKSGIVINSFQNFLVSAVPYASKDNSQLWTMNQRPVDTAQPQISEAYRVPVWASAWNGIFPVDMALGVIKGQQRLFALSYDKTTARPTVYELFTGERRDRRGTITLNPPVVFGTRTLMLSKELKQFEYVDLDFSELSGVTTVTVYAGTRRGPLYKIMQKRIVASKGSVNATITTAAKGLVLTAATVGSHQIVLNPDTAFNSGTFLAGPSEIYVRGLKIPYSSYHAPTKTFTLTVPFAIAVGDQVIQTQYTPETQFEFFKPQMRMLRTSKWDDRAQGESVSDPTKVPVLFDCSTCGVESVWKDRVDRGFQLVITWEGRGTLEGIAAYASKWTEPARGKCEDDEFLARSLTREGCGEISPDIFEYETTTSGPVTSQILPVFTSRILDVEYHADPGDAYAPPPK